jgi:dTDP-4-dehydrorhamnose reductase
MGYDVVGVDRTTLDLTSDHKTILDYLHRNVTENDIIINAAGCIPQRVKDDDVMFAVNTIFPHVLSKFKIDVPCQIIHVSTDCVYSGERGFYDENSPHDCKDTYGKSKSLGEPQNLTIIRTSIIGEEIHNKRSLLEWCKRESDNTVRGYVNHWWNGVTCLELCKHMEYIIRNWYFWAGVTIYYSPDTHTKYNLINMISDIFNLNLTIIPTIGSKCYRNMKSITSPCSSKTIRQQLIELRNFNIYC